MKRISTDQSDVMKEKVTCRIPKRRGAHYVLTYGWLVIKLKSKKKILGVPMRGRVLESNRTDFSFIVGGRWL